jgi:PKD repeat protein
VVTATYPHDTQRNVTLTVTDAGGLSSSVTKTINVSALPFAALTASCTGLTCTFDRSGSSSDAGISIEYWWFGDGQVDCCGVTKTHTYAQAGTYDVTMQILDANKRTATITKQITVGAPPPPPQNTVPVASFTATCDGLACTLDASGSTDDKGVVSYNWDLNKYPDGTATGKVVVANYPHADTRNVTLTVTDAEGLTSSVTKSISFGTAAPPDAAPVARFTWSCPTLTCNFDATSSSDDNGIVSYGWDLNKSPDGTASGATVTAVYPHNGTRNVTLTVTDSKGQTNSVTQTITIP